MKLISAWVFAGINVISGLILLPFILSSFSAEEINVWFLFFSVIGISEMVTIGFNATFTRFISYTYVGVDYKQFGQISNSKTTPSEIDIYKQLSELYTINVLVFISLGILYILLVQAIGYYALKTPISYLLNQKSAWVAWNIMVVSNMIRVMSYTYPIYIQGMNKMHVYYNLQSINKIVYIGLAIIVLLIYPSILLLTISASIATLITIMQYYLYFKKYSRKRIKITSLNKDLFVVIWESAWKSGVTKIIAPIISHVNGLIFAQIASPQLSSSYLITERVFRILQNVTMLTFNVYIPTISRLRSKFEITKVNALISKAGLLGYGIFVIGYVVFIAMGESLIVTIRSSVEFASPQIIILFSFAYLLSRIGGFQLNLANQANRIIEHKAIIIYAVVYFGLLLIYMDNIDMWIFPFAMIVAQIASFIYTAKISYSLYNTNIIAAEKFAFLPPAIILSAINIVYYLM